MQDASQDEVWFFILPCDWRFLPELGPPPSGLAGFFLFGRGAMTSPPPAILTYDQRVKLEITDLTCCRALFAAWVFFYHVDLYVNFSAWAGPAGGLIRRGYLGVDGFFILSGLLLIRVHQEMTESPATAWLFWGKRLARIYPVHLATILLLAALVWGGMAAGLSPRDPSRFSMSALVENLFLVQSWGFGGHWAWNYPSWSVSSEWAGYLLFPVIALLIGYFDLWVMTQIVVVSLPLLGFVIFEHQGNLNLDFTASLWRFFPEFLAGAATAKMVPWMADSAPQRIYLMVAQALIVIGTIMGIDLVALIGLWLLITSLAMQADAERPSLLPSPVLRWMGQISYSFYMSFAIIELLVTQLFRHCGWAEARHGLIFLAIMLAGTLGLAIILYSIVERPCRRAADHWLASKETA